MKSTKNLILAFSTIALLSGALGCSQAKQAKVSDVDSSENTPSENVPETDEGETEEKPVVPPTNITDAFEDNRPNYEDIFDFVPDYVKPELPNPDTKVVVTLDSSTGVKFKDGSSSKELLTGTKFTLEDFDLTEVPDGRGIEGFVLEGEGQDGISIKKLENFVVPRKAVKLIPVFTPRGGFDRLLFGPGTSKINLNSSCVGSFKANNTIQHVEERIIKGGENGFIQVGNRFLEPSPITYGSTVRFDLNADRISAQEGVFEYNYNVENFGKEPISFNFYQIGSYTEQSGGKYKKHYRIDVDLEPGESKTFVAQYKLGKNSGGNELLYLEADAAMNKADFGFSVSAKLLEGVTEPEMVSPEEPAKPMNIKLQLPEGIKVSEDYKTKGLSKENLKLPTDEQITNTTGRKIKGWYLVGNNPEFVDETFVLPPNDITIAPHFDVENGQLLDAACSGTRGADYQGYVDDATGDAADKMQDFINGKLDFSLNNVMGTRITSRKALKDKDFFRMLTLCGDAGTPLGIKGGNKYKFDYTIRNDSDEDMTFEFSQNQGGCKYTAASGAFNSGVITVKSGETKVITAEIKLNGNNKNIMPMIVMRKDIKVLNFVIQMVKHNL